MSIGIIASQAFSPNKISGLKLWLDASDLGTIIDSGGFVSQWNDKSANGNNARQATGALQPITGSRVIGIHNVIDFDGAGDLLELDIQPVTGTQARTIFIVGFVDILGGVMLGLAPAGGQGGRYAVSAEIGIRINGANKLFTNDPVEVGIPAIVTITQGTASTLQDGVANLQAFKDGVLLTSSSETNEANSVDTAMDTAQVGSSNFGGVLGEVIVYDRVLSTPERLRVERYLAAKWRTFTPDKLTGLVLWLDADDASTIIESSGFVSQWNDKSGNGNNATQLTGSLQPVTNANTINALNVITYDGVNDALAIPANSSIDNLFSGGGSVFSVVNPLTAGEGNFGRLFEKGSETRNFIRETSGGKAKYAHQTEFSITEGNFKTLTQETNLGVGNILGMLYDNSLTTNVPAFRVNGLLIPTDIAIIPDGTANSDIAEDLLIGNRPGGDRTWDGYFGEILMYDRILTAEEIADVENYLTNKWGI